MSEPTETPSLFPEEETPKKVTRRKSTAAPRKPRKLKASQPAEPAPEVSAPTAPAAEAAEAPAPKAKRTVKKAATPRKRTVKKTAAPAEPVAAPQETPVVSIVEPEPLREIQPEPPAAAPVAAETAQPMEARPAAPQQQQEGRQPRGRRGERRPRGNRRFHDRDRERQPQGPQPIAPSYAGAPVEEWSPRATAAPAQPAAPAKPAAPLEEIHIPRRQRPPEAAPQQPAPGAPREINREMSREERIAAARQQFLAGGAAPLSQPRQAEAISIPPAPEAPRPEPVYAEGIVEVSGKGFGFLRDPKRGFAQHPNDVFVTPEVCRRYNLRDGVWIKGEIRRGNRGPQLFRLTEMEGEDPENFRNLPMFDELTTVNPNHFIKLETTPERTTTRVIDLMAPIGRGQRGLIVAPPRTGKTTFLQHIAEAVVANHPDMKLIILLVDERPEEVTEIRRTIPQAELMASSNDQEIKSHTRIAQLAVERARRLVEMGKHVFILLDSITRVGRAFNNAMAGGGRTMSGGVDARALEIPRKLFASARNTEEAGSLTIVATALIETGSRMDDLIFQEFKGTGNMELVLDRKVSDLRIYPAVDIFMSGTRREELLLPEADLHKINIIRRGLSGHKPAEAIERLLFFLNKFPTNAQMLREIPG
ncbi:MAG: transcription termination factor Rho [Chthoniobacteraceae bacterium]|nr:transcription termination factor Rho [Chthoniobacteraceae bacterium]